MWGLKRKDHYESISKALALVNQCFVIACNSADENMAKGSAIISPFGNVIKDDSKEIKTTVFDSNEIKKTRKYIDIGLNQEALNKLKFIQTLNESLISSKGTPFFLANRANLVILFICEGIILYVVKVVAFTPISSANLP
jgi:hypothetical protein